MEPLLRARLLDHHGGRHLASEPHIRIQVLPVRARSEDDGSLFAEYHGELLIHCLDGACRVRTASDRVELAAGDQVLLVDGEPFRIDHVEDHEGVVQLIWAPGLNPCQTCWENNGRFYGPPKG